MKHSFLPSFQYFPYTPATCFVGDCGGQTRFPTVKTNCFPKTAAGGINELYFFPCLSGLEEVNILDLEWWKDHLGKPAIAADPTAVPPVVAVPEVLPTMGRTGRGIGSIGKKSTKTDRLSSCSPEQIVDVTWALKFTTKIFDESEERTTDAVLDELISRFDRYLLVARMCDGENRVLPVGKFTTSDFDWVVPEFSEDKQSQFYELSWNQLGKPRTIDVPGLSSILPKIV